MEKNYSFINFIIDINNIGINPTLHLFECHNKLGITVRCDFLIDNKNYSLQKLISYTDINNKIPDFLFLEEMLFDIKTFVDKLTNLNLVKNVVL